MNKLAETLAVFVSPINKLMDLLSRAFGYVWEPHKVKKMAEAEAYRIREISQAISENRDLPIEYSKDGFSIKISETKDLTGRALCRFVKQETQREYNLETIADEAYDILKEATSDTNENVSDDWIAKFISYAQDVSDEDMKKIWARILAGEVKKPGSFSFRTLSILRNLSKEEAQIFGKCCSLMVDYAITRNSDLLEAFGISYDDILKMDDCGLINSDGMITGKVELTLEGDNIFCSKNYVLRCKSGKSNELILDEFPFTASGRELYTITGQSLNDEFLLFLAKDIREKNHNIFVSLHKIISKKDDDIEYDDHNLLDD